MIRTLICCFCLATLAACNASTTSLLVGTANESSGTFTVTFDGVDYVLLSGVQSTDVTTGEEQWMGGGYNVAGYEGTDALAIGGRVNGVAVAGFSGTPDGTAVDAATYSTTYRIGTPNNSIQTSTVSLTIDLGAGAITGNNGSSFVVNGSLSGAEIGGSVDWTYFNGVSTVTESAVLKGGLFGTDEMAGAFVGDNYGGVIFGTK